MCQRDWPSARGPHVSGGRLLVTLLVMTLPLAACTAAGSGAAPAATPAPAAAAPSEAPAAIPVAVGYSSLSDANLGLWIAQDAGLFAQNGLAVQDFLYITSGTLTVQALIGNNVQFAAAGSDAIIDAVLHGSDLAMIAGASNKFDFALIAGGDIQSGDDLRAKRVGISKIGSSSDFAARTALQQLGLDPDNDVTILQIGGTGARLSALQSGAIDATVEIPPTLFEAENLGYHVVLDLANTGVEYEEGPISTTRDMIQNHPDTVRRFIRAYLEGIHRMKTDKQLAMQVSSHYTHTTDPDILEKSWERFAQYSIPQVPYITDTAVETVLKELGATDAAAGAAKPSQFYDNAFLKQAEDSGFVKQLYGS
ncbi:MAG TPA: ABC transporter substrate-binding protein [Chloroflexota bacterium]|nr:ABC transporter substrate-binding protein [Chloroflexota bacterium]